VLLLPSRLSRPLAGMLVRPALSRCKPPPFAGAL
jgi:hypothetical protein